MGDLKETFLKKYGIWEYILLVVGLVIEYKGVKGFIDMDFDTTSWTVIGMVTFVVLLGAVFIGAPKAILDLGRKRIGMDIKEDEDAA